MGFGAGYPGVAKAGLGISFDEASESVVEPTEREVDPSSIGWTATKNMYRTMHDTATTINRYSHKTPTTRPLRNLLFYCKSILHHFRESAEPWKKQVPFRILSLSK